MNLRDNTELDKHRSIAKRLLDEATKFESVIGVAFTGSIVREFADRYSDVDVIVVLRKKNVRLAKYLMRLTTIEQRREGVHIDLLVRSLSELKRHRWTELDRYDYGLTRIVYDPTGIVGALFSQKLHVPESFWTRRIVVNAVFISSGTAVH